MQRSISGAPHAILGKTLSRNWAILSLRADTRYTWPGNVRELQTVLRTAVLKTSGPVIAAEVLPDLVEPPKIAPAGGNGEAGADRPRNECAARWTAAKSPAAAAVRRVATSLGESSSNTAAPRPRNGPSRR